MKKSFLTNLPVRGKLLLSHSLISILGLALAACGLIGINRVAEKVDVIYTGPLVCTEAVGDLRFATVDLQRAITVVMSARGAEGTYETFEATMAEDVAMMEQAAMTINDALTQVGATESLEILMQIGEQIATSGGIRGELVAAIQSNDLGNALTIYQQQYRPILYSIQDCADTLSASVADIALQYYDYSMGLTRFLYILGAVMILFTLVSIGLITNAITKMICTPVKQLTAASERMQQGDLSASESVTYQSRDELGTLALSMRSTMEMMDSYIKEINHNLHAIANGDLTARDGSITDFRGDFAAIKESLIYILNNLNSTLSEISLAAEQVNTGSMQISAGAQTLAQGATEQASSVEELSSTIADISTQVGKTAQHAALAMEKMQATGTQVGSCNEQMQQMMAAMNEITEKSDEISKIVKTIEDIAFQTNILALNAAVEAARAGAAGKGFAVVADEVRNLAGKSAEASKTTSDLIGGTVDAVNRGTKIMQNTVSALEQVVEGSAESGALVNEIADAAQYQAQALTQISGGVDQISHVIQSTSSTSEESAASSEELSGQAQTLKDLLNQFQLSDNTY